MNIKPILGVVSTCVLLFGLVTTANASLDSRLGGLAYYDNVANLTWLTDANAAQTSGYTGGGDGRMSWSDANGWAAGLSVAGVTGWRLPETSDVGNDGATYTNIYQGVDYGYNITAHSEMSNMFYNVLGNTASYDTTGTATGCTSPNYCLTNTDPFSNLQSDLYWSATEYAPNTSLTWFFSNFNGFQSYGEKGEIPFDDIYYGYAWAVHSGDVAVIPIPAPVLLLGSGLLGLLGFKRRKASAIAA